MNKHFKIAAIATSLVLGYLPAVASAEVHSHPARTALTGPAFGNTTQDADAFEALAGRPWDVRYSAPAQASSCSGCAPLVIYGISF